MFISRFNRFFERHGRMAFLVIGIMIIIPFVFLGPWGRSGGGRSNGRSGPEVGTMYGKAIDSKEFREKLTETDVATFLRWGRFLSQDDRMFGFLVNETLRRIRALREAEARGLDKVSDDEVAKTISDHWMFQTDGKLDREKFTNFRENVLSRRGIDGREFDQIVRENIIVERLEEQVRSGVFVSPQEVREQFDRENESFKIAYCDFKYHDLLETPSLDPSKEEMDAYFEAHKADIHLPPTKRVRVVELDPKEFAKKVELSDKDITDYYERNRKRLYDPKKKTLDDVKQEITDRLKRAKSRTAANDAARALVKDLRAALEEQSNSKSPADLLSELAREHDVQAKDSGPFGAKGDELPEIGKYKRLRTQAYKLTDDAPVTDSVYDGGTYFIAALLETVDGRTPTKLEDVEDQVKEAIVTEKAKAFYTEHVETFREKLVDDEEPADLREDYRKETEAMEDKTDEEKEELIEAFNATITDYLTPYFVPVQRKVRVAVFSPSSLRSKVDVTDDGIKEYYDEHIADYSKEEVRVRQILMRVAPNAEDDEKTKQRNKLDGLLSEIREGKDFAQIARIHSEDTASKRKGGDLGYFSRGSKDSALENAAFSMEEGEISDIIETRQGLCLIKLDGKRQGQELAAVRSEIRRKIVDEKAKTMAQDQAVAFSDKVYKADLESGGVAGDTFANLAKAENVTVKDSDWFRGTGSIPPIGFERDLSKKAFALSEENPISNAIEGRKDFYVSCWLETKAAYLPEFDQEEGLPQRVERHMKREAALALAREKAQQEFDRIKAALAEGKSLDEAKGELKFETPDAFTKKKPLTGVSESRKIMEQVAEAAPGTLLAPVETNTGAVLAYIESRTPADASEFESERESLTEQLKRRKEGEVLQSFYAQLEDESNTSLTKEWGGEG